MLSPWLMKTVCSAVLMPVFSIRATSSMSEAKTAARHAHLDEPALVVHVHDGS
jgi:hypothetical protein